MEGDPTPQQCSCQSKWMVPHPCHWGCKQRVGKQDIQKQHLHSFSKSKNHFGDVLPSARNPAEKIASHIKQGVVCVFISSLNSRLGPFVGSSIGNGEDVGEWDLLYCTPPSQNLPTHPLSVDMRHHCDFSWPRLACQVSLVSTHHHPYCLGCIAISGVWPSEPLLENMQSSALISPAGDECSTTQNPCFCCKNSRSQLQIKFQGRSTVDLNWDKYIQSWWRWLVNSFWIRKIGLKKYCDNHLSSKYLKFKSTNHRPI